MKTTATTNAHIYDVDDSVAVNENDGTVWFSIGTISFFPQKADYKRLADRLHAIAVELTRRADLAEREDAI